MCQDFSRERRRLRGKPEIGTRTIVKVVRAREVGECAIGMEALGETDEVFRFEPVTPGIEADVERFALEQPRQAPQAKKITVLVEADTTD